MLGEHLFVNLTRALLPGHDLREGVAQSRGDGPGRSAGGCRGAIAVELRRDVGGGDRRAAVSQEAQRLDEAGSVVVSRLFGVGEWLVRSGRQQEDPGSIGV